MSAPQTTSSFLNSLGVNVHVEYTDGKYANSGNVINDLAYLGIDHVRDAVLNPANQGQGNYDTLASAGIKFDLFVQGNNISSTLNLVDAFVARHPGAVSMIEGPNEVNNFPISYNGQSGNSAATSFQSALYSAVHADGALAGVPVANLTSYPDLAGAADVANFHSYPKNGVEPLSTVTYDENQELAVEPGVPVVMTEGGYTTLLSPNYFGGVDDTVQAKYLLNLFCDNAKAGVSTSYIYELLDAYADPNNSDPNKHFGLFNIDNTPKLAATAIHNLTNVLSTGEQSNVAATPLAYEATGLPSTGSLLDLTKSANVHDLLIWNEPTIWNSSTNQEVAAPSSSTVLHFDDLSNVTVYDPLASAQAVTTYSGVHDVTVAVVDHPIILEVTELPAPAAAPAPTTPPSDTTVQSSVADAAPLDFTGTDAGETIVGGSGNDFVLGLGGADSIVGAAGDDELFGNAGNDTIYGGDGSDSLFGGKDQDLLFGDNGNDVVFGNLGADTLHGGAGADSLWGGQGNDVLFGDDGNDWLSGDLGDDTLTGGAGNDTFVFAPGSGHDVITDFTKGEDHIDISAYIAAKETFTMTNDGSGAHIAFSDGATVELLNVNASSLSVSGGWII